MFLGEAPPLKSTFAAAATVMPPPIWKIQV
jgi:hypothetical protein